MDDKNDWNRGLDGSCLGCDYRQIRGNPNRSHRHQLKRNGMDSFIQCDLYKLMGNTKRHRSQLLDVALLVTRIIPFCCNIRRRHKPRHDVTRRYYLDCKKCGRSQYMDFRLLVARANPFRSSRFLRNKSGYDLTRRYHLDCKRRSRIGSMAFRLLVASVSTFCCRKWERN